MVMDGDAKKKEKEEAGAVTNKVKVEGRPRAQGSRAKTRKMWQGCLEISVRMRSSNSSSSHGGLDDAEMMRKEAVQRVMMKIGITRRYRRRRTSIYLSLQVKRSGMSTSGHISTSGVGVQCVWRPEGARTHTTGRKIGSDQDCQRYV